MKIFLINDQLIARGSDVILGLPSIGNLGQIAMDCIISTLLNDNMIVKIGYIESQFLLPMVGYDSFVTSKIDICLPLEVYRMNNSNTILIIQRSLCVKGQQKAFSLELLQWLHHDISCVNCFLLTGGSIDNSRSNSDVSNDLKAADIFYSSIYPISHTYLSGLTTKYVNLLKYLENCTYVSSSVSTNTATSCDIVEAMNMIELEMDSFDNQLYSNSNNSNHTSNRSLHRGELYNDYKGMLLAKNILETNNNTTTNISSGNGMQVLLIGKLCIEGDNNINDGIKLAHQVIQAFNLYNNNSYTLKQPLSWKYQYGRDIQLMESSMFY